MSSAGFARLISEPALARVVYNSPGVEPRKGRNPGYGIKKEYEPRRMAGWHKGLHYIVRCLFLMHCKLMKPSGIFIPRIMSPLTGVPIYFSSFPGVSPLRGSTAGLPYGAPRRGSGLGSLHSRIIAHQAPIYRRIPHTKIAAPD